jgi:hypothetical protein
MIMRHPSTILVVYKSKFYVSRDRDIKLNYKVALYIIGNTECLHQLLGCNMMAVWDLYNENMTKHVHKTAPVKKVSIPDMSELVKPDFLKADLDIKEQRSNEINPRIKYNITNAD